MTFSRDIALDPNASIWVMANAGTGKTKLLTDRILRLLLKNCRPDSILCLTFTKEAAQEMRVRLQSVFKKYVLLSDHDLRHDLFLLTSEPVSDEILRCARALDTISLKMKVQIQTLHSLCHSLLKIFPLEAGLMPHFAVADEINTLKLQKKAEKSLLALIVAEDEMQFLYKALIKWGEHQFSEIISQICQHYEKFMALFSVHDPKTIYKKLLMLTHVQEEKSLDDVKKEFEHGLPHDVLSGVISLFDNNSKQQKSVSDTIKKFLCSSQKDPDHFSAYISLFLTQTGEKRVSLYFTEKMIEDSPDLYGAWRREQDRVYDFHNTKCLYQMLDRTFLVYHLAFHYIQHYQRVKQSVAILDFADLIFYANKLLDQPHMAPWILYKLDYKIEHILVDEAQDTNPAQWALLQKLSQEWYEDQGSGAWTDNGLRHSLFVVGDTKQSIYRFQGADPKEFFLMRDYYKEKSVQALIPFHQIALEQSFRSTTPILTLVDKIASAIAREYGQPSATHKGVRTKESGKVVLWKLCTAMKEEEKKEALYFPWVEKDFLKKGQTAQEILAQKIAMTIGFWLKEKTILPSKNRSILPKDILILVRQRGGFVKQLTKALENQGIQFMGCDRISLKDTLVIKDLLAAVHVALFVKDDLMFANLCKSPLIQMSEEMLFELAYKRNEKSLYETLKEKSQKEPSCGEYKRIYGIIEKYRILAKSLSPYDFYMHILYVEKGICSLKERMGNEITSFVALFLDMLLLYENSHTPSLYGFLEWFAKNDSELQSSKLHTENHVRIMTIHGSKGLQAPIVFLPTTTSQPSTTSFFSWTEDRIMVWPETASSGNRDTFSKTLCAAFQKEEKAEYMRLLYVALTRAEDQLYIGGWEEGKTRKEECWYNFIEQSMKEIKDVVETEEGLMLEEKGTMLTENAPVVSEELTFAPSLPAHMFKKVTNILLNINSSVE